MRKGLARALFSDVPIVKRTAVAVLPKSELGLTATVSSAPWPAPIGVVRPARDETVTDGDGDGIATRANAQFVVDAGDVALDRALREGQLRGDLWGRPALCQQGQDLSLPTAQVL